MYLSIRGWIMIRWGESRMSKKELFRRIRRSKYFVIGFIVVLLMVLCILLIPELSPYEPDAMNLGERLVAPEGFSRGLQGHILGTDGLGQDIFVRLCVGGRTSFIIAIVAVFFGAIVGTVLGVMAGYMGRTADTIIMRIGDIQNGINSTLLAIVVVSVLGKSVANLIIVMMLTSWLGFARIVRSGVLQVSKREFVSAARVLGASDWRIMFSEILPNVSTSLIVKISQQFGHIILLEAALSFLGCGVPLPMPSWGTMISDGRDYISTCPWVVIAPGIALMLTVLSANFLGDGIRDVLDPKMKH